MPCNEVEDGIHNLYELENTSQGQHLSQAVGGNWPVIDYSQWVGKLTQIGPPQNFNLKNNNLQQLGVPFEENYTRLTPGQQYSRSPTINNQLNADGFLLGCQNLQLKQNQPGFCGEISHDQQILTSRGVSIFKSQQENECADSPTLTTNSERSEITEASSDFNFFRGQQQLVRDQRFSAPQPHPMQQSGYNDMQLLQQHMMFKQLQELQRQQQLQQLGEVRQQNSLNQFSDSAKQAAGSQFSPLINGTPVHDASQMLRSWIQRAASPAAQGISNKIMFSQEQGQALRAMGLSQQLDASLYGTPVSNTRGNTIQYPHVQAIPHDSINLLTKASGQVKQSLVQPSGFGNPYLGDQSTVPSELLGLPQGALISKQGFHVNNNFGQVPVQGLNNGVFPGILQESNTLPANASVKEFHGRQEQGGLHAMQQTTKQHGPSQDLIPLDAMEVKILYNMDDNIWDSFEGHPDIGVGGSSNTLEHPDPSNAFPSIQSGSWSALMQSAVAEASSSDTGLQEEWSGLTFQSTEHSTDNQISNFVDGEKQKAGWVDNNLQSFSPKPFPMITDSSMHSSFPGFQQPGIQLSIEQREDMCQAGSHESIENYNHQQKPSVEEGQKVQTFIHLDNPWAGQVFEHAQSNARHQRVASGDISMDNKGNESLVQSQHQISNGPQVAHNSYKGTNETYENEQNCHQRENSHGCHTSKGLSDHEQGHLVQLKHFGNVLRGAMDIDKGSLSDFQGNSRASEVLIFRGDHGSTTSTIFHGSVLPDGSNDSGQTSEHMLELLHKVDQPREDSAIAQFGSTDHHQLPDVPGTDSHDASVAQPHAQSSASQGFGLRLAPPSQRLPKSSSFLSPQGGLPQDLSNLNSRQVNPELGEKNQTWLAPSSSFQSLPPSHEPSQRAHWDNKSGNSGHTGFSSHLNMQGNSGASFTLNPPYTRNQPQMHPMPTVPVASQSLQAALPGTASRYPHFNQPSSQDISQQIFTNTVGQPYPVLETLPVSEPSVMPGISQQGEISARPHNVWRNVPSQRQPFGMEPLKFSSLPSSLDASNNSMTSTSWALHGLNDQNSIKAGYKSSEFGASSNSQGFDSGEQHPGKEMSQQQISSKILDASQLVGISQEQEPVLDAALSSDSLASHSQQQDCYSVRHESKPSPASSERNLEALAFRHYGNRHSNYSLLNQVQVMNDGAGMGSEVQQTTPLGGQQLHDNSFRFRHSMDSGQNSASQSKSFSTQDGKIQHHSPNQSVKASLQPALQAKPQDMVTFGHNDSQTNSSSGNLPSDRTDHSQINLRMAPSWFKQYGTLRNGQMVPMFDTRLAKNASTQFSLGKPSQNFHIQPSLEQSEAADAGQGVRVWPSTAAALVAGQHLPAPYMLSPETTNQVAIIRPKKRKIVTPELLPWHKEVTQESNTLQNISVAEQDWARATNRLIEKVEDAVEIIEGMQPVHRSKRRLILTTQLMQQLFCPAPAPIFYTDSASNYDSISYFISRLSLGGACSLACCMRNDLLAPMNKSNMNSEKLTMSQRGDDQKILDVLEEFIDRTKKLENDFQRLDKTASFVDIRVEFQELERFSVINRFAKFHVRGQSDASGISSSSGTHRPIPQRYVTAFPMPRNLPEGVQCLSL